MSYNWQLVRGSSANPLSLKFAALQNKQTIAENEIFKPERSRPRIISKYTEDLVLTQDPFSFQQLKYINNLHYFGPYEPDGTHLKYWCMFDHIATKIKDYSFSNNYTVPIGNPKLCAGPSDGVKGGTIVTKINHSSSLDYFYTPDAPGIRVSGITTGFSVYSEFMFDSFESTGAQQPSVHFKVDNTGATDGWLLKSNTAGELIWVVRRGGTSRYFVSAPNKITPGLFYAVCLVYKASDNSMIMRINNEPQSNVGTDAIIFPTAHRLDLFHGIRVNQTAGKLTGRLKQCRWYNDQLFTSDEMDNIWNNKRSISPIPYGHISVAGVSRFNNNVYTGGYDPVAYDGSGFETI